MSGTINAKAPVHLRVTRPDGRWRDTAPVAVAYHGNLFYIYLVPDIEAQAFTTPYLVAPNKWVEIKEEYQASGPMVT